MAATAWDMVSEKRKADRSCATSMSDEPLVPDPKAPGARFGGFGFAKQGERMAAVKGFTISRPLETLPRK